MFDEEVQHCPVCSDELTEENTCPKCKGHIDCTCRCEEKW